MKKKIFVLLFLVVLLVFVYQAGFDPGNPTEVNDVNEVHLDDPTESNEANMDFTYDDNNSSNNSSSGKLAIVEA